MDPAIGEALRDPDDGWAYVHARATLGARLVGISLGSGNIADLERQQQITEELQALFPSPRYPFIAAPSEQRTSTARPPRRSPSPSSSAMSI